MIGRASGHHRPGYYKWTQWIFLQIYNSWYDQDANHRPADSQLCSDRILVGPMGGSAGLPGTPFLRPADEWQHMTRKQRHDILSRYRLAYVAEVPVNWCEGLRHGSRKRRGRNEWVEKGYSVERRPMKQWMMRITRYADRLLQDARSGRLAGVDA